MAVRQPVWGIDVGQCALKAIKLRGSPEGDRLEAVSFDYIEHSKILSQPDADATDEIRKALETFLSRNDVKGDRVAVSVPGQAALARFIQLPPVETRKIPEIVRYEARQQIPFDLSEVIWDYQMLGEGQIEEGFAVGTEIGLFAIRRDVVQRLISSFQAVGLEVEVVQTAPLALYNYAQYDLGLADGATVLMDIGTDNTNLVIADAKRIWQRNVPIGGNTFTKALIRDFKLTFAKAEHLKRNATKSPDARRIFQSMRSVFTDLTSEVQRSMGYYTSLNRESTIKRVIALGNAFKLPGLLRFLTQNLNIEVVKPGEFAKLAGSATLAAPIFQENLTSFTVAYGLALQGLELTRVHTNLILPEITQERMIRRKKPWVLAAAAALMLGFTLLFVGASQDLKKAAAGENKVAIQAAEELISRQRTRESDYRAVKGDIEGTIKKGDDLTDVVEMRSFWPDILRAINAGLPKIVAAGGRLGAQERKEVSVEAILTRYESSLETWWANAVSKGRSGTGAGASADAGMPAGGGPPAGPFGGAGPPGAGPPGAGPFAPGAGMPGGGGDALAALSPEEQKRAPQGRGWVFELTGYTYHKDKGSFVQQVVLPDLEKALGKVGGRNVILVDFSDTVEEVQPEAIMIGTGRVRSYERSGVLRLMTARRRDLMGPERGPESGGLLEPAGLPAGSAGMVGAEPGAVGRSGLSADERRAVQRVTRTRFVIEWVVPLLSPEERAKLSQAR